MNFGAYENEGAPLPSEVRRGTFIEGRPPTARRVFNGVVPPNNLSASKESKAAAEPEPEVRVPFFYGSNLDPLKGGFYKRLRKVKKG